MASPINPSTKSLTERGHAQVRPTTTTATGKWATKSPKGLFAMRELNAGCEIFGVERCFVAVLSKGMVGDHCGNCYRGPDGVGNTDGEQFEVKACTGCKQVWYCGKKCQAEAWKRSHKFECRKWDDPEEPTQPKNRDHIVRAATELLWRWHKGSISQSEWDSFQDLKSNYDLFSKETRIGFGKKTEFDRKEQADKLGELTWRHTTFDRMKKSPFTREQAVRLIALLQTNSLTLIAPSYDPIGIALDPFAARANHSCSPNAYVVMDGPSLSFRTLKPIPKDSEIFISYIDPTDSTKSRLDELATRYYFNCNCTKCRQAPGREDKFSEPMPVVSKAIYAMYERPNFHDILQQAKQTQTDGDRLVEELIFATEKNFQLYLRGDPDRDEPIQLSTALRGEAAFMKNQNLMCILKDTGVWPEIRQPYPALRHQYFLGCLSLNKYSDAFYHGLKTYFDIDPKLYPVPYHPLRVVHTFSLSRLAMVLVMEATECPEIDPAGIIEFARQQGYDFAPMVYKLIKDAKDNVVKSHGENNSFTKMVNEKWEEVITDMGLKDERRRRALESVYESNVPFYRKLVGELVGF
ncbi:set and mynd domain [Venturia nashicola]|uniref:Set and mynd domain n=1 Tax=Venturia nashicola TaxID=86259 RepID=A0A4Z1PK96_9PEZI|nr:set and mynd domain [Venturia nashicola]TLD38320.1 set and mynd domain [Venturia nashicola]